MREIWEPVFRQGDDARQWRPFPPNAGLHAAAKAFARFDRYQRVAIAPLNVFHLLCIFSRLPKRDQRLILG
jgi:hypothetical protein